MICSADVCVAMIPEWPWAKYGFHGSPTKLFEYMALKRTVVTTNHGQMSEILNDGIDAILCSYDASELLRKLLELKSDRDKTGVIGQNAWQRVHDEFNWECITEKTLLIFESLVNHNSEKY